MLGHNLAPDDADPLLERLQEQHGALMRRKDELLAGAARVPEVLDEALVEKVTSFIKQVKGHAKILDTTRVGEKEPFDRSAETVHGFFKKPIDELTRAAKALEQRLGAYLRAKEEEERRRREEEARQRRLEAERAAAEQRRIAEEERQRQAAEERQRREEEERRIAALREEQDVEAAIKAERQANERAEQAELERQGREAEAARAADAAAEAARKAERAAQGSSAELARTRGAIGGVATLRTSIAFERRGLVDLEALRPFIADEAIDKAIRAYVRVHKDADLVGSQPLPGVEFFRERAAMVA